MIRRRWVRLALCALGLLVLALIFRAWLQSGLAFLGMMYC